MFIPFNLKHALLEWKEPTGIITWNGYVETETEPTKQKGYFKDKDENQVTIPNVSNWELANDLAAKGENSGNRTLNTYSIVGVSGVARPGGKRPTKTRNTIRAK